MIKIVRIALYLGLLTVYARGQEPASSSNTKTAALLEHVKVYSSGPDVTQPALLPPEKPVNRVQCHKKLDGSVRLSFIVDSNGQARNIVFDRPLGSILDELALKVIESDRFQPGKYQGTPAAFARSAEMRLQGCVEKTKDSTGADKTILQLRTWPEQKIVEALQTESEVTFAPVGASNSAPSHLARVGSTVTPPRLILPWNAEFSDYARRNKIEGTCIVTLVVDAHGLPQNVRLIKGIEPSLDTNAITAVLHYRFKPARDNGEPVPVQISAEVRFRLY